MILVDTSIWFAAYVDEDPDHEAADAVLSVQGERLVTTDYIIDELLTLLVSRGQRPIAKFLGQQLWAGELCQVIWVSEPDIQAAWQVFDSFDDKTWSFTDCVSYAVMKRIGIVEAFALDDDFKQFGFVTVQP
jgi:predicted nucleic acid-binding protein